MPVTVTVAVLTLAPSVAQQGAKASTATVSVTSIFLMLYQFKHA